MSGVFLLIEVQMTFLIINICLRVHCFLIKYPLKFKKIIFVNLFLQVILVDQLLIGVDDEIVGNHLR